MTKAVVQSASKDSKAFYLPALDGLRFIAFLMVFLHHGLPRFEPTSAPKILWNTIAEAGDYGVPLFFVLSSFLITQLLTMEREKTGDINVKSFYLRRILRIWPLYFFILTVGMAINPLFEAKAVTLPMLLGFLTFTGNFQVAGGAVFPMTVAVLWSVCVEEQFYLVWPWAVKLLKKNGLTLLSVFLILAGTTFRLIAAKNGASSVNLWFSTFTNLDCFGYGCLGALYASDLKPEGVKRTLLYVAAFTGILITVRFLPITLMQHVPMKSAFGYSIVAFLCAFIVSMTGFSAQNSLLAKPFFNYLGRISYGLYCYHQFMFMFSRAIFPHSKVAPILVLPMTILAAAVSFKYFETTFLKLRHKFQIVKSGALAVQIGES